MQRESKETFQSPQTYVHVDKDQQQNSSIELASSGVVPRLEAEDQIVFLFTEEPNKCIVSVSIPII